MNRKALEDLVEAHFFNFATAYKVTDFPKLHHIFALIETESAWDPSADSGFARGLMQVSREALEDINRIYSTNFSYEDMFRPYFNIFVGIRYLRRLYRMFLEYEHADILAVMAYNWGVGNVVKWLTMKDPSNCKIDEAVPRETKEHLLDFLFWTERWKQELEKKEWQT